MANRLGTGRRGTKAFVLWAQKCIFHEIFYSKPMQQHNHLEIPGPFFRCTEKNCPVWGDEEAMKEFERHD